MTKFCDFVVAGPLNVTEGVPNKCPAECLRIHLEIHHAPSPYPHHYLGTMNEKYINPCLPNGWPLLWQAGLYRLWL